MNRTLIGLFAAVACVAVAGCGGSGGDGDGGDTPATPPPPPPVNNSTAITGTTAYGILGTSKARIAFVAAGASVVPVLVEGSGRVTGSAAGRAQAHAAAPTAPSVALTFTASACAVDSNDLKGICIGFGSAKIAVLDLKTFATTLDTTDITVTEFDSGAGDTPNSYSGGSCILCGVAPDVGKKRYVVGGAGGFRVFAYGSRTATVVYDLPVGENFAFLPQSTGTSYVIAPEYEPSSLAQRKLRVIDLDKGKAYVWTRNTDSAADLGPDSESFQRSEVDAAAVDLTTKMIALSTESSADFLLVDFAQAVFDENAQTFSAPFSLALPAPNSSLSRLTDVAISTTGSILLSHGEAASNLGVTLLPKAAGKAGQFPTGLGALGTFDLNDVNFDRSPCGSGYLFTGKFDPHGLGLFAGLDKGQRGLIVDADNTCAAVIDLAVLTAAPRRAGAPNVVDTGGAAVKAAVRFRKLD